MERIKDYTDKEGNKWEVYMREGNFWRHYYMGTTKNNDYLSGVPTTLRLAFSISKDNDYNGHKEKVIEKCIENYAEENLYNDITEKGE